MSKKICKYFLCSLLLVFLLLYFFGSNIFPNRLTLKRDLTINQIEKFEEDVKNGKEIDLNEYIIKDKTYENLITKTNKRISNIIESGFKKIFKYLLKNIDFWCYNTYRGRYG